MRQGTTIRLILLLLCGASMAYSQEPETPRKPLKVLIKELESPEVKVRRSACDELSGYTGQALDFSSAWMSEGDEVTKLQQFRTDARPLVPELIKLLSNGDSEVRSTIINVVAGVGPSAAPARPALLKILRDPIEVSVSRINAAIALLYVSPIDKPVGPELLAAIGIGDGSLPLGEKPVEVEMNERQFDFSLGFGSTWLASTLCASDRVPLEIPSLVKLAQSGTRKFDRGIGIVTLGFLGVDGTPATLALWKLLDDDDQDVRIWTATALMRIVHDPKILPELNKRLRLGDADSKIFQQGADEHFAEVAEERELSKDNVYSIPFMVGALRHGNGFYRRQAIRVLREMSVEVQADLVPELVNILAAEDADVRDAAYEVLKNIDPGALP